MTVHIRSVETTGVSAIQGRKTTGPDVQADSQNNNLAIGLATSSLGFFQASRGSRDEIFCKTRPDGGGRIDFIERA